MGKVATNNEIRIEQINDLIKKTMGVIPFCLTRAEAEGLQADITKLEEEKESLEQIESEVCPECGSYEIDTFDDLACGDGYHDDEWNKFNSENKEDQNPMCKKYPDSEVLPDEKGNCSLCGGDCNETKED